MLELTERARVASEANNLTPNLVLEIEGVPTKYGAVPIKKFIRIGDPGLLIDGSWVIGGFSLVDDQSTAITFEGTSTNINQKLDVDKGSGSSVSQTAVSLVDIDEEITRLITPGQVVDDLLARKCTLWVGFGDTAFPDDYVRVFRGIIDKITAGPGKISLQLSHPDRKKLQSTFLKFESKLNGAINNSQTTIDLLSVTDAMYPILGANGLYDSSISYGIRIEDEVIFYTGISGNTLTGCTRGALFTTAASHSDQQDVESFIRLQGNVMDLALKLMLSGWNGPYQENLSVTNFNILGDLTNLPNAIFFQGIDVADEYGVVIGDYITTTGASGGANNVTNKQIIDVVKTGEGSYILIDGVAFTDETTSAALIDFRSQYDTLHPNAGMQMHNNEVDIEEHEKLKRFFLSSFEYDFYIRDTQKGKEFLENQVYFPASAFSVPRKSQASVGYHIGPLPNSDIKTVDTRSVVNASRLNVTRSISSNFFNTVIYQFEEDVLNEDQYHRGDIEFSATSKNRIKVGTNALVITSKGIREVLSGQSIAQNAANRRLRKYKFAAESIDGIQVTLGSSFNAEIGDIVIVDMADLQMSDTKNATRSGEPRLFQIVNKTFDIRTGKVVYNLVDTAYSTASRYCLMSPSTRLMAGSSSTVLKLAVTGNSVFGTNEGRKWSRYIGATVRVRSDDFTTRNDISTILSVSGNTLTLSTPLGFTPFANDTLTIANYDEMPVDEIHKKIKLIYGFMRDSNFGDGSMQYQML